MGKKKNKNKCYNDEDSPLYVPPTPDNNDDENNDNDEPTTPVDENKNTANTTTTSSTLSKLDIDTNLLRSTFKSILKESPDKSHDWYLRTLEKNSKLPKKSLLGNNEASGELEQLRYELEDELDAEFEEDEEEREKEEKEAQMKKEELEEARKRAEARVMGRSVSDENKDDKKEKDDGDEEDDDDEEELTPLMNRDHHLASSPAWLVPVGALLHMNDDENDDPNDKNATEKKKKKKVAPSTETKSNGLTVHDLDFYQLLLLTFRPYGSAPSFMGPAIAHEKPPPSSLHFVWMLCWYFLSLFASSNSLRLVETVYEADAPKREAERQKAEEEFRLKEEKEDEEKRASHLWCPAFPERWISVTTYVGEAKTTDKNDDDDNKDDKPKPPDNIRFEKGRWERWAKNLKTKTKKGGPRGTWVLVKPGDGWASAPAKLETPNDALSDRDIQFFGCLEKGKIIECTEWVINTLMSKKAARGMGVVDNGRVLFQFGLESKDEGKGVEGWVLDKYIQAGEEEGGEGGEEVERRTGKKSKKSRAEKRAKQMGYGR